LQKQKERKQNNAQFLKFGDEVPEVVYPAKEGWIVGIIRHCVPCRICEVLWLVDYALGIIVTFNTIAVARFLSCGMKASKEKKYQDSNHKLLTFQ
jgi:hypothetical protein